jgi:hypothetical protein
MSIIDIPIGITIEGVLSGKRKTSLFQVMEQIPIEIQDIKFDDVSLIAMTFNESNSYSGIKTNVLCPYIEYKDALYEPYINSSKLQYFSKDDNVNNLKKHETLLKILKNHLNNANIDLLLSIKEEIKFQTGINPETFHKEDNYIAIKDNELPIVTYEDIKKIYSDNRKHQLKKLNVLNEIFICIEGQLYRKSYGPMLFLDQSNTSTHSHIDIGFNPILRLLNYKSMNLYNYIPYSLAPYVDQDYQGKGKKHTLKYIQEYKNNYDDIFHLNLIVFFPERLHHLNKNNFGFFLFMMTFDKIEKKLKNDNRFIAGMHEKSPELDFLNWLNYIQKKYSFGNELSQCYYKCIESNYDIHIVLDAINQFYNCLRMFNTKEKLITDMHQYLPIETTGKIKKNSLLKMTSDRSILDSIYRVKTYFTDLDGLLLHDFKDGFKNTFGHNISFYHDYKTPHLETKLTLR